MKLVVGLGNIGQQYETTPHNVGFMVLERLAKQHSIKFEHNQAARADTAILHPEAMAVTIAKPRTMMNLSGHSVRKLTQDLNIEGDDVLIVSDDFNLPFGQLRVRQGGEHGGHNGLDSIISAIGPNFWRFRIGVATGHLDKSSHSEFVLTPFAPEHHRQLKRLVERAAELLEEYLLKGHLEHETIRLV